MEWTYEQQQYDVEDSHCKYASKAAGSIVSRSGDFVALRSGSPLVHTNCAVHVRLSNSQEISNFTTNLQNIYQNLPWTIFLSPLSTPPGIVDALMSVQFPAPVTSLKKVAITGMAMDTSKGQYKPHIFPEDHPANRLEIREAVSGASVRDFAEIFWETLANAGRSRTDVVIDQIVAVLSNIDRDFDPIYKTFVAYEDGVAAGCCSVVLDATTGVAGIYEMGVSSKFRGKGYAQKLFAICCDYAIDKGYTKLVLYATPMGQPMYEKFGFHSVGKFYRLNYIPQ